MTRPRTARIEQHGNRFRVAWMSDGNRKRRSFDTKEAASEFLTRLRREELRAKSESRIQGGLTVGEMVANWYRDHRRNLAPGTQRDYEGRIRRDIGRIGTLEANRIADNPRELRAFYATLTPTNARRLHAILHQAFEDALLHHEVERNPCEAVKPRKPRTPEKLIPSPTQVEKIVLSAEEEDPLWGLFLNVTATLGMRRGETCGLRWEDVDAAERRSTCAEPSARG